MIKQEFSQPPNIYTQVPMQKLKGYTENQVDMTAPKITNLTVMTSNRSELDEIPDKNVKRMMIIKVK